MSISWFDYCSGFIHLTTYASTSLLHIPGDGYGPLSRCIGSTTSPPPDARVGG
jgi:hypothetical protein